MTKISYKERINLYYDRKNGMSFTSIKSKYGINKSRVEYLVILISISSSILFKSLIFNKVSPPKI